QPRQGVIAVALLGAVALRRDDEHAILGQAAAGEPREPRAHGLGKRRRSPHVEPELHGGVELVDVLPARTRGTDEALLDLALVDGDFFGDADHVASWPDPRIKSEGRLVAAIHVVTSRVKTWMPGTTLAAVAARPGMTERHSPAAGQVPLRQHLALLDRRLVEGVDAEKVRRNDRLQHEVHQKLAET